MQRALVIVAAATVSALAAVQIVRVRADDPPVAVEPELRRAAVLTETTQSGSGRTASVSKGEDGHFWAEAQVQGRRVRFLVDTGASSVALTRTDAQRLGLAPAALVYDRPVSTAGGKTMAAAVTLDYVSVAGARVDEVEALVLQDGLEVSLLGMTYLGRLNRFEATRDSLILRR